MSRIRLISLGLISLTILISAWFYPQLPAQVPSHWDINGTVDGWQTPLQSALFVPIVCIVLMTVLWLAGRLYRWPEHRSKVLIRSCSSC
jgi:uncharacterized membrane protein